MDENPYRSPRETGYRPPAEPAKPPNYINFAVAALLAVIFLTGLFCVWGNVVNYFFMP